MSISTFGQLPIRWRVGKKIENHISVKGQLLTVTCERQAPEGESRTYHLCETGYGSFTRSFTLPEWVDADKAHADDRHGILYIQAPKREESKPRMIPIQATES